MSHSYTVGCQCQRCVRENGRRLLQAAASNRSANLRGYKSQKHAQAGRERTASREEQHARYIDCGPGAWDDRE